MRALLFVCSLTFYLLFSSTLSLYAETQSDILQGIYDSVMSPYCPGRTLSACPSDSARKLKADIENWILVEGDSKSDVLERLNNLYGDQIYGAPKLSGVGFLSVFIPIIVLFGGAIFIFVFFRSKSNNFEKKEESKVELEEGQIFDTYQDELKQEILKRIL